jgi:hypothetical protein
MRRYDWKRPVVSLEAADEVAYELGCDAWREAFSVDVPVLDKDVAK